MKKSTASAVIIRSNEPANERAALAARLREAREYVQLSQEEVAQILQIPRSAISLIEKGERKVDALELKQLAQLYQRSVESLTNAEAAPELPQDVAHLARTASKLKARDLEELTRFAQFLAARKQGETKQ
jgi:transcriptional regulator with XRE-family HTH domain